MNTLWLDQKYAQLAGTNLEQFKVVKSRPFIAKFRCPVCGDSQSNKFKTRGHFYEHNGHINVKCFNCSYSTSLSKFLKQYNNSLYSEYRIESLREQGAPEDVTPFVPQIESFSKRRIDNFEPFKQLKKVSQLSPFHPAKKYISDRKIPSNTHFRLYYTDIYCHWVNSIIPNKFGEKSLALDEPRIVLPFVDSNGYVFGFTGRAISKKSNLRYSTIMLDETKEKIFGMESVDRNKTVYLVEGPIDSLFLTNCVAMAGSDVRFDQVNERDKLVIVYDNEPRSKEIVKKIERAVTNNYKVCIWPDHVEEKDINDMVMNGMSPSEVQFMIDHNTFSGLAAKMRLQQWKKV
jgi:hypothetical protein